MAQGYIRARGDDGHIYRIYSRDASRSMLASHGSGYESIDGGIGHVTIIDEDTSTPYTPQMRTGEAQYQIVRTDALGRRTTVSITSIEGNVFRNEWV